nr:uncharacterized protein LOC118969579 isoform X2 [Manis javanica]
MAHCMSSIRVTWSHMLQRQIPQRVPRNAKSFVHGFVSATGESVWQLKECGSKRRSPKERTSDLRVSMRSPSEGEGRGGGGGDPREAAPGSAPPPPLLFARAPQPLSCPRRPSPPRGSQAPDTARRMPRMNSTHKVAASGVAQLRLLQHLSPRLIHSAQKTFSRAPP